MNITLKKGNFSGLLEDLIDANISGLADNDLLQYNSSITKWENKTIADIGFWFSI